MTLTRPQFGMQNLQLQTTIHLKRLALHCYKYRFNHFVTNITHFLTYFPLLASLGHSKHHCGCRLAPAHLESEVLSTRVVQGESARTRPAKKSFEIGSVGPKNSFRVKNNFWCFEPVGFSLSSRPTEPVFLNKKKSSPEPICTQPR